MRKMMNKLFAVLLAGTMTVGAASTIAFAVEYDLAAGTVHVENDKSWQDGHETFNSRETGSGDKVITITQGTDADKKGSEKEATNNTVQVGENVQGVTITLDDVNVQAGEGKSAVEIGAGSNVEIAVSGENILKGGTNGAGIAVPGGATLTLGSDEAGGTLKATGNGEQNVKGTSGAGIGGTKANGTSGTINIDGVDGLTAQGYGEQASGIGSAFQGNSGAITIKDSTVDKVTGGFEEKELQSKYGNSDPEGGAAIGGGGKGGTCGDITITDSTISSAHGGSKATAIGGSCWADVGNITITNSTLNDVVGGSSSAGIGVGRVNRGSADADANITIRNSTVNVTGGEYGAGIGTGYNGDSVGNKNQDDKLASTKITIENSNVTAVGGNGGAAIGGGYKGWNTDITIQGGTVVATGGILEEKDKRAENGASAIGSGANGSGKFEGGTIAIDGNAKVIAISNGGKWAIDLACDVSGVVSGYQNMFLVDSKGPAFSDDQIKNDVDDCTTVPYETGYTVIMGDQKIVLPAGFLCAAVTTGGADGVFHTTNEDGTWYFSHYGTVGSDSEEDRAAYGNVDTVEKLGTVTVEMTVTGDLAANSYLHVALRAGGEVPSTPDGDDDDDGPIPSDDDDDTDPDDTEIADPDVPMNDLPGEEPPADGTPSEELADPDVPLADLPDEDVPLSAIPRTGDVSGLWLALTALSGCALMGLAFLSFRKREEA